MKRARLIEGSELRVAVDPEEPSNFILDWESWTPPSDVGQAALQPISLDWSDERGGYGVDID